jgi:hypothetical protein
MLQCQGEGGGTCGRDLYRVFWGKKLKRGLLANLSIDGKVILKWAVKKTLCEIVGRIYLAQDACH